MRAQLSLLADLIQIGQGVGLVLGGVGVAVGIGLQLPTGVVVALAMILFGLGVVMTYAFLSWRARGRPLTMKDLVPRRAVLGAPAPAAPYDPRQGQYEALKRALEEARAREAPPDLRVRVSRRISPTGNTAGESFRRWLHLFAENMSPTIAHCAKLHVRIQRETTGDERHAPIEREWLWTGIREQVDLRQGAPIEIPIAIADVDHPTPPLLGLRPHEHLQPVGRWWITPEGHRNLTHHDVLLPARYWMEVTLTWTEAGSVRTELPEHFLIVIPENRGREAELIHTVSFDRY